MNDTKGHWILEAISVHIHVYCLTHGLCNPVRIYGRKINYMIHVHYLDRITDSA
jgi:hypothetical protein